MTRDALPSLAPALTRLFGALEPDLLAELTGRIRLVHLERGRVLYRQGEMGAGMHVVLTGRLQASVAAEPGEKPRVVAHLSPGEAVGEMALFTGGERAATVTALRDSALGHLTQDTFDALMVRHPAAAANVARFIIGRLLEAQRRGRPAGPRLQTFAIIPLEAHLDTPEFARRLQLALLRFGSTALVDPRAMRARFAATLAAERGPASLELERFLDVTEERHDFVVLEADPEPSPWTRKCASYAERLVFVATASTSAEEAAPAAEAIVREAGQPRPPCELVLVHPERSAMPRGTRRWLDSVPADRHLHVPWAGNEGFNRLARILSGNAVAVVLGGGGARGFAHVGVVRALREAGVPIDAVGGTSFGAIVAAFLAMGWDEARMLDEFKVGFVDESPTNDYTLPIMSLVQGEKMARGLRRNFGDALIEDLWIPFFAVSSNLSRNREQVHNGGPLWRALRASVSLPAIFPPLVEDGDLLVDGGILNNLPVDVMRESVPGRTIAVDLSVNDDFRYGPGALPSAWEYLKGRLLRSAGRRLEVPTLARVVLKATMLGSRREVEAAKREADLFLNPPVKDFDLLGWERFHDIVEVGYRYGREQVAAWAVHHPEVVQREEMFDSRLRRNAG